MDKEAFDPDAVFFEDIVDDKVLPRLSLAVDGLTNNGEKSAASLAIPSDETAANQVITPSTSLPVANMDPEVLEVYGWESSIWKKVRSYLGF